MLDQGPGTEHHLDEIRDRRIAQVVPLETPDLMLADLPLLGKQADVVYRGRSEIKEVLDRTDDRLLVVVGPCSVHDVDAALDYAHRLAATAEELGETCAWRCACTSRSRAPPPGGRA